MTEEMGDKQTEGKLDWSLLPWEPLREVVKVYDFGARKYDSFNWHKGVVYSKLWASMLRHMTQYWLYGERDDKESGCHHMAHVVFWCFAFMTFDGEERSPLDDRRYL